MEPTQGVKLIDNANAYVKNVGEAEKTQAAETKSPAGDQFIASDKSVEKNGKEPGIAKHVVSGALLALEAPFVAVFLSSMALNSGICKLGEMCDDVKADAVSKGDGLANLAFQLVFLLKSFQHKVLGIFLGLSFA